jgi:acetyl/propionyl-CoA carboxylase alpha subunit
VKAKFAIDGVLHEVTPARRADGVEIRFAERARQASLRALGDGEAIVTLDGAAARVWIATEGDEVFVHAAGRAWRVTAIDAVDAAHGHGVGDDAVIAPMPGTVVAVPVSAGTAVRRGDVLIVLESMKLETSLKAPRDGVVASAPLAPGATFDRGAVLVTLAPEAA